MRRFVARPGTSTAQRPSSAPRPDRFGRPAARNRPPVPGRLPAIMFAALLVVAACGATPSPSPSLTPLATSSPPATAAPATAPASTTPTTGVPQPTDEAAVYRAIQDQVVAERGLAVKERLDPTILTEAQVSARMEEQFTKENPPDELATAQATLVALGLLDASASLRDLYVEMLGSQVAGYYDTETKQLYVVSRSGAIGGTEKATFAHEFTHALQDQNFGLAGVDVDAVGQGDRSLARLALVEGDATLLMARWMVGHLTTAEMQELLTTDPEAEAQLARMPAILRESLLFPYQQGATFVSGIWTTGGWKAVDRVYDRLPDSTEQVLHPTKYAAGEKPIDVALDPDALAKAMGPGWTGTPADTMGEFTLSVWLRENGLAEAAAGTAAAGWGGDRYAYLRGPNGSYALALLTAWDTQADADEFLAAARTAAAGLPGAATVRIGTRGANQGADQIDVLVAGDAATLDALARAVSSAHP